MDINVLAIDPSGNHISEKEGSGTTGIAYRLDGGIGLTDVRASDYKTIEEYWDAVLNYLRTEEWDHIVFEGYRLYNHAGMAARTQTNSTLQTSQLIGAIRMEAWRLGIPYHIQYAVEVKGRWTDKILQAKGYLKEGNKFNGKNTNDHKRDSLRHLVHFETYKLGGLK